MADFNNKAEIDRVYAQLSPRADLVYSFVTVFIFSFLLSFNKKLTAVPLQSLTILLTFVSNFKLF